MEIIKQLINKKIRFVNISDDEIVFILATGEKYKFYHEQDCCEIVEIEDICGDFNDLVGCELLQAEVVTNENENPEGVNAPEHQDSFIWTFYKFASEKGHVTVRWYGESNGHYSESVNFAIWDEKNMRWKRY